MKNVKIKRIRKTKALTKYDLEIEDNHNFYANGVLVHNCRRILFTGKESIKPYGANRKGLTVSIDSELEKELLELPTESIIDGEDLGSKVVVFDVLDEDLRVLSYRDRLNILVSYEEILLRSHNRIQVVKTAKTTQEKKALYQKLLKEGKEGIVFKDIRAPYTPGRPASGGTQVKFKFYNTCSCIVTGVNKTKRSISLGLWDPANPESITDVGNATVYPNQEVPIMGSIVEIKYLYAYRGGYLYQPILLGDGNCERNDIDEKDCLMSQLKYKKEESE